MAVAGFFRENNISKTQDGAQSVAFCGVRPDSEPETRRPSLVRVRVFFFFLQSLLLKIETAPGSVFLRSFQ